jgi:Tfp pilus assembly protein PilF
MLARRRLSRCGDDQQQGDKMKKLNLVAAALVLVAGCTPAPMSELRARVEEWMLRFAAVEAHALYARALKHYEAGDYVQAAYDFDLALTQGLPAGARAAAHKHLAFIYCAADLAPACASEFRKALIADPDLHLDAAEAGHPAWGPVFQVLKAQR